MMTKEQQLSVLNAQNTLAKKTLLDITNDIEDRFGTDSKEYRTVESLIRFSNEVVDKLIAKNSEAEQILQMWINFNKTMEEHPHVGDRWNELMAIMTLVN